MKINEIRKDFAIFERRINGREIVYLDSAATSLKPRTVVAAMRKYYEEYTANIHRGVYRLSEEATEAYEGARRRVARFIGAKWNEVVFVRNATEAINLVMYAWGKKNIKAGDEIVVSVMEHHANLVPWQRLAKETGAELKFIQLKTDYGLDLGPGYQPISRKTKLLALTEVSNVLGVNNHTQMISALVKDIYPQVKVLIDGAQGVPHHQVKVSRNDHKDLGYDWYVFSGHKMLGPTGIGVLWGREELLEEMEPFMFGGDMIQEVRLEESSFKKAPWKFEAGTPAIAEAIGLGAAVDYLENLGMIEIREHEMGMVAYGMKVLSTIKGLKILGPKNIKERGGVISFTIDGMHPHDLAQVLDEDNICIRAGHHCAMPLHKQLGLMASARVSFYVYNTTDEIELLVEGIEKARRKFKLI